MTAPSKKIRQRHARVLSEIEDCIAMAQDLATLEAFAPNVSQWNVGQHLEHTGLVDRSILAILEKPAAEDLAGGPTPMGRFLLVVGFIPRGRAKAPAFVDPRDLALPDVEPKLSQVRERFMALGDNLAKLDSDVPYGRHHVFGTLDGGQWLRFISIHHRHHLKIVRDIRHAQSRHA